MLGIDIIDLKDPLFKKRNKSTFRFIAHPQDSYFESENAFWFLWAAKEAAFKTNRELMSFVPRDIPVHLKRDNENEITFRSGKLISGRIFRHDEIIISLASYGNLEELEFHYFKKQTNNESAEAREVLHEYISKHLNLDVNVINDGNGLPVLSYKNLPVSISHHGNFIAFTYPKIPLQQNHRN